MPAEEVKSPSQRLREVFYALYIKKHLDLVEPFDVFYARQMEKIINHVKDKINE